MKSGFSRRTFLHGSAISVGAIATNRSLTIAQTGSLCLPPGDQDESELCQRGPIPTALRLDSIGIDAPIEVLETVGGAMQQPTDEIRAAWYKETARLGEVGNMLIAGHLNWWSVPEAVFFDLARAEAGDILQIFDEVGIQYSYAVEWIRQDPIDQPPAEDALGVTDYAAATLITCGGRWDSAQSEYDSRTILRARSLQEPGLLE